MIGPTPAEARVRPGSGAGRRILRRSWRPLALLLVACLAPTGAPSLPQPGGGLAWDRVYGPRPAAAGCARFQAVPEGDPAGWRHEPEHVVLPAPVAQPRPAFRFAVHTLFLDQPTAALAARAGFDTVVQVFPWRDLNPAPTHFTWQAADDMVRVAAAHELDLVVRLDMPPAWARGPADDRVPFDLAAYGDFVTAVARRYRGLIRGYIIWNEPNLAAEWARSGGGGADHWDADVGRPARPADYLGLVGLAFHRLRAADPAALVIAGGLAPTNENSARAQDDRRFLDGLYAAGPADCFDVWAVHDYGYGLSPWVDSAAHDGLNFARIEMLRAIMSAQIDDRPVWITELGYTIQPGQHPAVDSRQQADYLVEAYRRTRQAWPWVEMLTVWNLALDRPAGDEMSGYSLVEPDGTPRLAFERLRRYFGLTRPGEAAVRFRE